MDGYVERKAGRKRGRRKEWEGQKWVDKEVKRNKKLEGKRGGRNKCKKQRNRRKERQRGRGKEWRRKEWEGKS